METWIETPELDRIKLPEWLNVEIYKPMQVREIKSLLNNRVWITARQVKMKVSEMETSHIINCIRCFNGEGLSKIPVNYLGGKDKWIKIFNTELLKRQ